MSGFSFENHSSYCHLEFTDELLNMPWEQIEGATNRVLGLIQKSNIGSVVVIAPTLTRLPDGLLASLLRIWKSLDSRTRNLIFVTESDAVKESLQISGLLEHWRIMPSRAAALAFLKLEDTGELDLVKPGEKPSKNLSTDIKQSVSTEPFPFEAHKRYNGIQCDPLLSKLSWADLEAAVSAAISSFELATAPNLLLYLSRLTYINSGVVAGLVRLWKATQKRQGQFSVVSPHEDVTSVLKTSGLARVWTITDTREEAAYALGVSESALVEKRERTLLVSVSVPFSIVAALALIPMFLKRETVLGVNSQLAALLLGSAALTTGLIALIKEDGIRRKLSAGAVLMSIMVLSTLVFRGNPISIFRSLQDFVPKQEKASTVKPVSAK
ncbi:MAG: anti-sigma factor antagonist [Planctomycetota bacterium]|nr:MAG: anti-sigma factor antagonist [Planctomycetota bacterium]